MRFTVTPFIDETYPDDVVFLAVHVSDAGTIPWGDARLGPYCPPPPDPCYIPQVVFGCDVDNYVGYPGPNPTQWINRVEAQLAMPTDITIDLSNEGLGLPDFTSTATVCMEAGGVARDVRVFIGYTMDDWPFNSQYRYRATLWDIGVEEDVIGLAPGECVDVVRDFTFDARALTNRDTVVSVAWAQTPYDGFGEAYQAAKLAFVEVFVDGDFDATGDFSGWSDVVN